MNQVENKSFWDRFAGVYDWMMIKDRAAYRRMVAEIQGALRRDMKVLEIACGTGLVSVQAAPFCRHLTATDFSKSMIRTACRKKAPLNVSFSIQNAARLTFAENSFDAVIISSAFHILPRPRTVLGNIRRVLKKDGLLLAPTFVRRDNLRESIMEKPMELAGFRTYHRWTPREFITFLADDGWEVVHSRMIPASFPIAFVMARTGS